MTKDYQGSPPSEAPDQAPDTIRSGFQQAFKLSAVMLGGMFVLGMGLGVLVNSYGLPWWLLPLLSAVIFAGSVEFLTASLLAAGAPISSIALTTLLVNARHLVYGISYPLHRVRGRFWKFFAIYTLCDEAYVLNTGADRERLGSWRILWVHILLYSVWISSSLLGFVVGAGFLGHLKGIDFVMTALFTVMAMDAYRENPDRVAACCALGSAALALVLAPGSMLLVSMSAYVVLLLVRFVLARRAGTLPQPPEFAPAELQPLQDETSGVQEARND